MTPRSRPIAEADGIDITVAVCTRDRARQLARLLNSFEALRVPREVAWELVVVDNGSTDGTADLLWEWSDRLPLRIIEEPRIGLSHARNTAVRGARGRYICWTDDDAIVPADWLAVYWQAFQDHPAAAVFGGRIVPKLDGGDSHVHRDRMRRWPLSSVVAHRDLGPKVALAPVADRVPWGTNFAVRGEEQRRFEYDVNLQFGEETDLIARVLASGASGWWLPESQVRHVIDPTRLGRAAVGRYFRRAGRTAAYLKQRANSGASELAGADGWTGRGNALLTAVATASALTAAAARLGGRTRGLRAQARASYLFGILEFRKGTEIS